MSVFEIVSQLMATSKKNEKKKILLDNIDNELLKRVLVYALSDRYVFGFTTKNLSMPSGTQSFEEASDDIFLKLDALMEGKLSGHEARDAIEGIVFNLSLCGYTILTGILDKNLRCGVSTSLTNEVWPGLITTFDVALAESFEATKPIPLDGTWLASRKLDGLRCITIIDGSSVTFWTRKGVEYTTLSNLIPEIQATFGLNRKIVLDGELSWVEDTGLENFTRITKEYKRKNYSIPLGNLRYYLFDEIYLGDFQKGESATAFETRIEVLRMEMSTHAGGTLCVLEQEPCTPEVFAKYQVLVRENGWEGFMLRNGKSLYRGKRTKDLLKVKLFKDAEYVVLDIANADFTWNTERGTEVIYCMNSVVIEHKGFKVNVGSGWSKQQRIDYERDPSLIIGKTITVRYFEETTNDQGGISLRFPTVKIVHDGERDV